MHTQEPTILDYLAVLGVSMPFSFVSLYIAKRLSYFKLDVLSDRLNVPFKAVLGAFLLFFSLSLFVFPVLYLLFGKSGLETLLKENTSEVNGLINGWVNVGVMTISAVFFTGYLWILAPQIRQAILGRNGRLSFAKAFRDFCYGMLTLAVCYPIVLAVSQLLGIFVLVFLNGPRGEQVAVLLLKMSQSSPSLFAMMLLTIVLIVPFIEELLFRGFLQSWLVGKLGIKAAILLTSLIFALFHYSSSQGVYNVEILGSLFVLSCFLGYNTLRRQSLWASVGLHAFFNFTNIIMILNVPQP